MQTRLKVSRNRYRVDGMKIFKPYCFSYIDQIRQIKPTFPLTEICKYLFKYLHEFLCSFVIAPKLGLELMSQWREVSEIEHEIYALPFRIYAYNG